MAQQSPPSAAGNSIPEYTAEIQAEAIARNEGYDDGRAAAEIDEFGIYNSGPFRRDGPAAVTKARNTGEPLGLVLTDSDGLKAINDELGHAEGDKIIDKAKYVWQDIVKEFATRGIRVIVGRIGGDEFAARVHGDEEQTRLVAEEFEKRYRGYVDEPKNRELRKRGITTSVGYANLSEEITDFSALMHASDKNMYENKVAKLGELSRRDKLCLLAAKKLIELSSPKKRRLRDAPKYWRMLGVLD